MDTGRAVQCLQQCGDWRPRAAASVLPLDGSDGGEEAGDNREEAAGGVKNSAQETSNVKTELTLLNES